jgi:multicomponent Na+:H+ antiporter subunit F
MNTFLQIMMGVLTAGMLLCLDRIGRGPTAPDRTIAVDILGTIMVGFCCVMAMFTGQDYYLTIGIAWALTNFIGTLALAKYLEGRCYDA